MQPIIISRSKTTDRKIGVKMRPERIVVDKPNESSPYHLLSIKYVGRDYHKFFTNRRNKSPGS